MGSSEEYTKAHNCIKTPCKGEWGLLNSQHAFPPKPSNINALGTTSPKVFGVIRTLVVDIQMLLASNPDKEYSIGTGLNSMWDISSHSQIWILVGTSNLVASSLHISLATLHKDLYVLGRLVAYALRIVPRTGLSALFEVANDRRPDRYYSPGPLDESQPKDNCVLG